VTPSPRKLTAGQVQEKLRQFRADEPAIWCLRCLRVSVGRSYGRLVSPGDDDCGMATSSGTVAQCRAALEDERNG
jgi:hypothetical protein